jgi:hypothetical protein
MRKAIYVLLFLPMLAAAQDKTVISYNRISVKSDKVQQFEKALTTHSQKYHKGDVAWRVSTIESGPDAGAYLVIEGPNTWEALDKRGDLGAEHTNDWSQNIMPFTTEKFESGYLVYREELSSVPLGEFSEKTVINHIFFKPGYLEEAEVMIKNFKKTWDAAGQSVAVYEASASGAPQFIIVTRYKNGLKERTTGYRKPMKERYEAANGNGSWNDYQSFLRNGADHSWSEMTFYKKELSSN